MVNILFLSEAPINSCSTYQPGYLIFDLKQKYTKLNAKEWIHHPCHFVENISSQTR